MTQLIPEGFTFATETSAADWIVERLKPWGNDRVRLWSFMPDVFDRYARVFHPIHGAGMTKIRWSELAERRAVGLSATTRFRDIAGEREEHGVWEHEPQEGTLYQEYVSALRDALAPFTTTPERCWLAVWVGWGSWRPGSRSILVATTDPVSTVSSEYAPGLVEPPAWAAEIKTQHREYFLLEAHLDLVPAFEIIGWHQSPSIWWPEDRAWCVVTEVDGYSTYVGGTEPCVNAVITSTGLEAIHVPADVPMDPGPY
jgi:hypothetical protein